MIWGGLVVTDAYAKSDDSTQGLGQAKGLAECAKGLAERVTLVRT